MGSLDKEKGICVHLFILPKLALDGWGSKRSGEVSLKQGSLVPVEWGKASTAGPDS